MFYVYRYKIEGAMKRDKGNERAAIQASRPLVRGGSIITAKTYTSSGAQGFAYRTGFTHPPPPPPPPSHHRLSTFRAPRKV